MALEANLDEFFWGSVIEYTGGLGNCIENSQYKQEI